MRSTLAQVALRMGRAMPCHRRPDRSVHLRGRPLPICARCTGVLIGNAIAVALLLAGVMPPVHIVLLMLAPMALDWSVQQYGRIESTNVRRLVTGTFGGYAVINLYAIAVFQVM